MQCPVCGADDLKIIKSKKFNTKKGIRKEIVLQCQECNQVHKESLLEEKPEKYNLIISEHENSFKTEVQYLHFTASFGISLKQYGQTFSI